MFERVVIPVICGVFIVALVVYTVRSFRRGGYGPAFTMPALTRAGRRRTNRSYEKHGWAKPYDDDGNLLPRNERTLPDQRERAAR